MRGDGSDDYVQGFGFPGGWGRGGHGTEGGRQGDGAGLVEVLY